MQHGHLDRRVSIQRATETQDSTGQVHRDFVEWIRRPAQCLSLVGAERFAAQQVIGRSVREYVMLDDSQTRLITSDETFRLFDEGEERLFDIVDVRPSPRRREFISFTVRGRSEGAA